MQRRFVLALAGSALAALLLFALLRGVDARALAQAIDALPLWNWLAATAGLLATYALRALRLREEWAPRAGVGFRDCLSLMLVHNAAVNVMPMRSGEASYALLIHRRWGVPIGETVASLVRLRVQDAVVLGALALGWLLPVPPLAGTALALALVGAVAGALPSGMRALQQQPWRALRSVGGWLAPSQPGRSAHGSQRLAGWTYATSNWLLKLLVLGALLQALASLDLAGGVRGAVGGELAALLPLQAPAGLGTYEAGVWGAVALHAAVDTAQLAGAALVVHVYALVVSLGAAALAPLLEARAARPTERSAR